MQKSAQKKAPSVEDASVHLSYRLSNYYREPERLRSVSRMVRVVPFIVSWFKNGVARARDFSTFIYLYGYM